MFASREVEEKRRFIRMVIDCPVEVTPHPAGSPFIGTARNLSGGGLLIECDQAVTPGTLLSVRLAPDRSLVPPLRAIVEVVRAEESGGGRWAVGVSIRELLG